MDVSWCLPWFNSKSNQWYLEMMTRLIMWKIHETSKEFVAFSLVRTFIEESQSQVEVLQGKKRWPKHDYCNNKNETAFTFFIIMPSWYWIKFVLYKKKIIILNHRKESKLRTFSYFHFTWIFAPKIVILAENNLLHYKSRKVVAKIRIRILSLLTKTIIRNIIILCLCIIFIFILKCHEIFKKFA